MADLTAVKGGAAVVALFAGAPWPALPGRLPLIAAAVLPLAGFLAPDALLARHAGSRRRRMEAELPDLLDLLRVAIEAGLPVGRALGEVGRRHGGPLAREWAAAARELELGVPRDEAFDRLVRRCRRRRGGRGGVRGRPRHGAPLAGTLHAQAAERDRRARRIRSTPPRPRRRSSSSSRCCSCRACSSSSPRAAGRAFVA